LPTASRVSTDPAALADFLGSRWLTVRLASDAQSRGCFAGVEGRE